MKTKLFSVIVVGLTWVMPCCMQAQSQGTPFLERVLTLSLNQERVDAALKKIAQKGGFTFSYNPAILDAKKIVSYNFINKTVREILDQLFGGTLQYKVRGRYIILTKSNVSSAPKAPRIYSGYIVDEATGERLKDVSIYDPVTLSSTITDSYGYFEIEIDKPDTDLRLAINKQNYSDTSVVVPSNEGRLLNIPLSINTDKISTFADSIGSKVKRFWQKTKLFTKQQVNMANINDTLYRKAQISFIPFIGTNHALSGNVINDYSFNILGGYSLGVKKLEIGGNFNVVRGDVQGVQFAGTFNAIGRNVEGIQLAGVFNAVGGDAKSVQLAGVFNANRGSAEGAQLAGVFNFNWNSSRNFSAAGVFNFSRHGSHAVQLAGVQNVTIGDQESPQLAGLFNFTSGSARSQLAGIINFASRDMMEGQVSGILNFSGRNVRGAQIAGILNFAGKEAKGAQIAGILNYATKLNGVQLGLINVADSVKGIPIGLLSVVLKGYHKIEVSADELFYTNIAFRTGIRQFYNIITAGARPSTFKDETTFWTFGYGIGTAPKLSRKWYLNFDLTSNQIMQGNSIEALNLINKAYIGFDFQLFKNMSLSAGATLNVHLTENSYDGYRDIFSDYRPEILRERNFSNDLNMKMWLGGKIGIRFL